VLRPSIRPGFVLAIALAVVALPAAASALPSGTASPARAAVNSQTFQDSTGEDPAAPDITTIVVSNDDAGIVSFRINIPNRPTLAQDMLLEIWINTDNNTATGDPDLAGVDYVMQVVQGEIVLYRWDGTGFTRRFGDPSAVTLSFSYQAGITVRISATELGNTKAFRFFVDTVSGLVFDPVTEELTCGIAPLPCPSDIAPGGGAGLYLYTVVIAKPTLVVRRVTTSPAAPRSGRPFTLRMVAARSDTGAVLQNGRVTCVGRAGTARLKAQVARVVGGAVVCTWLIPVKAKGKTFKGSATVVFEGLRATGNVSRRIA
jgi:hypothetical protein